MPKPKTVEEPPAEEAVAEPVVAIPPCPNPRLCAGCTEVPTCKAPNKESKDMPVPATAIVSDFKGGKMPCPNPTLCAGCTIKTTCESPNKPGA
jgi:hypothetical protein